MNRQAAMSTSNKPAPQAHCGPAASDGFPRKSEAAGNVKGIKSLKASALQPGVG
jgi:hypothetical protein